jgi:SAM-dependent methyltransferase
MFCNICNGKLIIIQRKEYSFFECENCRAIYKGFSFLPDYSTNSESYNKITNEQYFNKNVEAFIDNSIIKVINKYANTSSKILDIGCSNGAFLYALKKTGIDDVYGIDTQEEVIEFAIKKNLNCYYGSFPNQLPKELLKKYNIITSFENIYYMSNLLDFFDNAFNLLKANGKIILKFNQSSSSYYFNYPYHIRIGDFNTLINLDTISFLAKKYNFNVLEVIPFDNNYITNYLGYASWKTKPKEKINFILQVANKISKLFIPVKYADKILVVLEKN